MGPNLYITPPASFTLFHQDGFGTVDSGHLCISGYNEVVMLRRLPERHKEHALSLLKGKGQELCYNELYELPHGDGLVSSSFKSQISVCFQRVCYVSVLFLICFSLIRVKNLTGLI